MTNYSAPARVTTDETQTTRGETTDTHKHTNTQTNKHRPHRHTQTSHDKHRSPGSCSIAVTLAQAIERIQFCYPQVYYACHTRHDRARSSSAHLSARDSEILVHLDSREPLTLSTLAAHMDLSRSTLSEAVTKLESFGYIGKQRGDDGDRRRVGLILTKKGVDAVRANSVLEAARLRAALSRLTKAEQSAAVRGLELLARAARTAVQHGPRFNTVQHGLKRS